MRIPGLDLETLEEIVEFDNQQKVRFLLCRHEGMLYIRTAQGHSKRLQPHRNWNLVLRLIEPRDNDWVDEA
eukprot:7480473-Alexandrium_andersonii.AAC.1